MPYIYAENNRKGIAMTGWKKLYSFILLLAILCCTACAGDREITSAEFSERLQSLVRDDFGELPEVQITSDGVNIIQITANISITWLSDRSTDSLYQASLILSKAGASPEDTDIYTYYIMTFIQAAEQELTVASYNRLYDALQLSIADDNIHTKIGAGARNYEYIVSDDERRLTVIFQNMESEILPTQENYSTVFSEQT